MLNYPDLFARFGIPAIGVIHIGGFVGSEDAEYARMGFKNRLFIEAQPDTFLKLKENLQSSSAFVENVAISDKVGTATFNVLSNGQSSSLLKPTKHLEIYPDFPQLDTIIVNTTTVDTLLAKDAYTELTFNFINMDIQGAEMLALRGATASLAGIDAINLEVNFDELYEGAPHIRQVDAFLGAFDFIRVDTVTAHRTWGDAFYVRNKYTKDN